MTGASSAGPRTVWCVGLWEPHAAGLCLVLQAHLVCRVHLPAGVQQGFDLGFHLCHASGGGLSVAELVERVGPFEAHAAEPQEQLVRGSPTGTRNRIFTTSRIAGTSQNSASIPDWEGGWAKTALSSCFWARVSFAAFWFPACPVRTEHILLSRQPASHSRMVFTLRSTISAMMLTSTPREAYRIASAFTAPARNCRNASST